MVHILIILCLDVLIVIVNAQLAHLLLYVLHVLQHISLILLQKLVEMCVPVPLWLLLIKLRGKEYAFPVQILVLLVLPLLPIVLVVHKSVRHCFFPTMRVLVLPIVLQQPIQTQLLCIVNLVWLPVTHAQHICNV